MADFHKLGVYRRERASVGYRVGFISWHARRSQDCRSGRAAAVAPVLCFECDEISMIFFFSVSVLVFVFCCRNAHDLLQV